MNTEELTPEKAAQLKKLAEQMEKANAIDNELWQAKAKRMTTHKPQHYLSPIHLTNRMRGNMRVRVKMISGKMPVVGLRQAICNGLEPCNVNIVHPIRVHHLEERGRDGKRWGTWMTDLPEELNQIHQMLHDVQPKGYVLIGGLGLGIVANLVWKCEGVKQVRIVERNLDVIKLCAPNSNPFSLICDDIHHFLRTSTMKFDYYLLDTWQMTNEMTWWNEVMPMRRAIRNKFGSSPVIHAWAEDIMLGQVQRCLMLGTNVWYYKDLPKMSADETHWFTENVGITEWEERYAKIVDRNLIAKGNAT